MFESALAHLRFAASIGLGKPFAQWSLDRIVAAILETQGEFGALGRATDDLAPPRLDAATRLVVQAAQFRKLAARAARETAYYATIFRNLGLDPAALPTDTVTRVPLTRKRALREEPDAFVSHRGKPCLRCLTHGTTGTPTGIAFSRQELEAIAALSAIGFLLGGIICPDDIVHIGTSARALLGNLGLAGACAHIGATAYLAGLVSPEQTLAMLAERRNLPGKKARASILSTYPSYLGELVEYGLAAAYTPRDFGVERIITGGEVVTEGLKRRSQRLFGPVNFVESYAMTETIPFSGTACSEGHLHFEPSYGLLEVLDPDSGAPAGPGETGNAVVTPFAPYRETTLLLRYDTEDVLRVLAEPSRCSMRNLPATSLPLGKRRLAVRHDRGWTYPRDVLEALESIEEVPLPARCAFAPVAGGVAIEAAVREPSARTERALSDALLANGVPLQELRMVSNPRELHHPLPLRSDLREAVFV